MEWSHFDCGIISYIPAKTPYSLFFSGKELNEKTFKKKKKKKAQACATTLDSDSMDVCLHVSYQVLRWHQPAACHQWSGYECVPGWTGPSSLQRIQHAQCPPWDLCLRQQVQPRGESARVGTLFTDIFYRGFSCFDKTMSFKLVCLQPMRAASLSCPGDIGSAAHNWQPTYLATPFGPPSGDGVKLTQRGLSPTVNIEVVFQESSGCCSAVVNSKSFTFIFHCVRSGQDIMQSLCADGFTVCSRVIFLVCF